MSKRTKTGLLAIFLVLTISFSAFAQNGELQDLQRAASNFSSTIAESLPLNASLGLNWSDAHIGRIFPGFPPSFGVGVSAGFTSMELGDMNALARQFGFRGVPNMDRMPFPGYTVETRIGGFILPFDVGFKFGTLPSLGFDDFDLEYFLIGGDIRYAVLNRPFLPRISVAVGFNYMRGSIGGRGGSSQMFAFADPDDPNNELSITLNSPNVNLNWSTRSLDFRVQVSQSFIIVTPYLGLGASYAWSRAGYEVRANVTGDIDRVDDFLRAQGLDGMNVRDAGISSNISNNAFGLRVFGGASLNLAMIRLDITGLYSFLDGNYGASLGIRFQL